MKTVKTIELTGEALNWVVSWCELCRTLNDPYSVTVAQFAQLIPVVPDYAGDTTLSSELIERERIHVFPQSGRHSEELWFATHSKLLQRHTAVAAPKMLLAGLRCYVVMNMGEEINIPEELL